ncbi:MAG: MMPL family transporter [Gammaproteobacteria bacterium]|nr:MMPL family transporter [Gammaproteobacteria bacterium]
MNKRSIFTSFPFLLLLLLNLIPPAFLPALVFNNTPEVYLPDDTVSVVLKKQLEALFPEDQNAFILFQGKNIFSNEFLDNLEAATLELQRHALIDRVANVTEMEHIQGNEEGFYVEPLLGKERRKEIVDGQERYQYAKDDRFAYRLAVGDEPDIMAIMIRPVVLKSTAQRIEVMNAVSKSLESHQLSPYVIGRAGPVVVEIEQFYSMLNDTMKFMPTTVIIGLALIWFMYRRLLAVVIAGLITGAVTNSSLLMYVVFSIPYTMITMILSPLLASLSIAFMIHFYSSMQLAASYGLTGKERVSSATNHIKKPALFTALTTALGLSSLAVSPIMPIGNLGLISAFGVVLMLVLVLYVVPAIFARQDDKPWPRAKRNHSMLDSLLKKLVAISIRRAGYVVAGFVLLIAAGIPFIFSVTSETSLLKFFPPGHIVTQSTELIEDKLSGVMPLQVIFYGDGRDSFKKVNALKQVEAIQKWLETQPEISKTSSLVDLIVDMHKAINENNPKFRKIPEQDALISQYFFIYDGDEVYELVNREFDQTRIVISLNESNSARIRDIIERVKLHLEKSTTLKWAIAGEGRVFADQDRLLIQGQLYSLITAVILIFLVMIFLWRKLSYALLTMVPNLSPVLVIFILMGIFGIWLDMATAMIASVATGIAVDDTIHLFHNYKKRIDKGNSVIYSVVQSYYKTGRALVVTTIILCAQFFLLFFSEFVPTAHFGLLTAIGLIMALVFDLLLLPALIVVLYHKKNK